MRAPFVVRVPSAELADRLQPILRERGAAAVVETVPDADVTVGLREVDGPPRWLRPMPGPRDVASVVAFLERWGFIPRAARTRAAP